MWPPWAFDLPSLEAAGSLVVDHINVVSAELVEAGDWGLEGLFIRLGAAIDAVGARRVVIDTIETLFGALTNAATLRSEIQRLFVWLKARGVTVVITGERGDGQLTRHGIEEYVSDCVIVLDHLVTEETSTRRPRVLKYRGSLHGTNEFPVLIGGHGISVQPITSLGLQHAVFSERVSTGVDRLDVMLGGLGPYRGSSVLVSGTAGTGKSTLAAQFCDAACSRGERAIYFAFEESQDQIIRNMSSVGLDLGRWVRDGLLQFRCVRPSLLGLEAHLLAVQNLVEDFEPSVVVMDPISDLAGSGSSRSVNAMLTRQVDFLKARGVTALLTDRGIELADVYVGPQGVLTGSARSAQEAKEHSDSVERQEDLQQRRSNLERQRQSVEAQVAVLWREFEDESKAVNRLLTRGATGREEGAEQRLEQGRLRSSDGRASENDAEHVNGGRERR